MPASSEQQQKLFGLALSVKRGKTPRSEVSDEVLKIVDSMSEKKIEDFAGTKHKGIPKKVKEISNMKEQKLRKIIRQQIREITKVNQYINETSVDDFETWLMKSARSRAKGGKIRDAVEWFAGSVYGAKLPNNLHRNDVTLKHVRSVIDTIKNVEDDEYRQQVMNSFLKKVDLKDAKKLMEDSYDRERDARAMGYRNAKEADEDNWGKKDENIAVRNQAKKTADKIVKQKKKKKKSSSSKKKIDPSTGLPYGESPALVKVGRKVKNKVKNLFKKTKVKNPETGNDVQLSTALSDKSHPAYKAAKKKANKMKKEIKEIIVRESSAIREDKMTPYQAFFKKAMDKFDVSSPDEFESEEKKKEFFDYVDKHWKANNESTEPLSEGKAEDFEKFVEKSIEKNPGREMIRQAVEWFAGSVYGDVLPNNLHRRNVTISHVRKVVDKIKKEIKRDSEYGHQMMNAFLKRTGLTGAKRLMESVNEGDSNSKKIGNYNIFVNAVRQGGNWIYIFRDGNQYDKRGTDFKPVAKTDTRGNITWLEKNLPSNVKKWIEKRKEELIRKEGVDEDAYDRERDARAMGYRNAKEAEKDNWGRGKSKKEVKERIKEAISNGYTVEDIKRIFNEAGLPKASTEAKEIAHYTGTGARGVQSWIDRNNIDAEKLAKYARKSDLQGRLDIVTAIVGKPNNKYQNKLKKMFGESVNEKIEDYRRGDTAHVVKKNKTGMVLKQYGQKVHLKFPDGTEKTFNVSDLKKIHDENINETKFFVWYNKKKHEIEAPSLYKAKQKFIKQERVPKSKQGLIAIKSADSMKQGDFRYEAKKKINEKMADFDYLINKTVKFTRVINGEKNAILYFNDGTKLEFTNDGYASIFV